MSETLLKINDLHVYFPIYAGIFRHVVASVKAVNGVSLEVEKGQVLGLVGESGSGKSTIGRAALDLIKPTSGSIEFLGKDFKNFDKQDWSRFRQEVQIVFQDPFSSLNPRKSIGSAIGEPLLYHGIAKTKEEQKSLVAHILEKVGLSPDMMDRYPHQFSGGQQQRICIGRAIALNPKLIICDEVVSALDVSIQAQILNLLYELKEKLSLSYLFISHDLSIIRHLSDRVAVLYLGKVMETASVKELFENPKHPYTQALLSAAPNENPHVKRKKIILKGQIPSPIDPPSGCPFRTRCPYAQEICKQPPPKKTVKDPATGQEDHHYYCIL
ncbi:MAG TPA: ATP-binding cassette domain-containing protein [Parachlamydiaceae bacterium]|nr:ATP-binding cassette domain-containing protein [Parachlamydiaceae bacterium]